MREAFAKKDYQAAAQIFTQVLEADGENAAALAGLARCQVETGDLDGATVTLALVPAPKANDVDVLGAKAALDLALNPVDVSEIATLQRQVEGAPADFQARLDLAIALNAAARRSEVLEHLLHIIAKDRSWNEDAARKQLVKFFEAWGPKDEFTLLGRRRLSAILFA